MRTLARWCLVALSVSACRHAPTKVSETTVSPLRPIEIGEDTVVLDTRAAFDFGLTRVDRAVHFPWERLAERADTGELIRDLRRAGERLALVGVTPRSSVVVVGPGPRGGGEEGRLAWTLLRLGLRDVQVASNESLRRLWTQKPATDPANATPWTPAPNPEFELDRAGLKNLACDLNELKAKRIWLIDVRSEREYLGTDSIAGSLNVAWTEFYGADGRPDVRILKRLAGVDVRPADHVVLISRRGVRAGAAAYALMTLGFSRVQVYRH